MKQRSIFTATEGDRWFERNRTGPDALRRRAAADPLLAALEDEDVRAERALEVGASNGWRLAWLAQRERVEQAVALEPSAAALADAAGSFPEVAAVRGTAERLPFAPRSFDLVLLGFCLYLCDRDDLFRIACEVDRVLTEDGRIALYDFHADAPHKNAYAHAEGVHSYKMDHARMFAWNPLYALERHEVATHPGGDPLEEDDRVAVSLLRRRPSTAWPRRPQRELASGGAR